VATRSNKELESSGARGRNTRAPAGSRVADKEELCLCGGRVIARGSIPDR